MDMLKNEPISELYKFSPAFIISTIVIYLMFVYLIAPRLMKNRPAFQLKRFMSVYNIIQVVICLYIINKIWSLTSWNIFNFRKCIKYYPNTPERKAFIDITLKILLLKIFELTDTIIFVLRKKQNQITYLHVFHHASTITLCYLLVKFYRGIDGLFAPYLNTWVHVVMYSYYFFANVCSAETMKRYIFIKKSITIMQMIQFCFILIHASFMWSLCEVPVVIRYYYCLIICVLFYGFYDFYKKAYKSEGK